MSEKIVAVCLRKHSALAERVGQGEEVGVTCRVLYTWKLLGLAQGEPIILLPAWIGLESATSTL